MGMMGGYCVWLDEDDPDLGEITEGELSEHDL